MFPPVSETPRPGLFQRLSPTSAFSLFVKKETRKTTEEDSPDNLQSPRPSSLNASPAVMMGRRVKLPPIIKDDTRSPSPI